MGGGWGDRIAGEKGPTNNRGVRRGQEREKEGLEAAWDKKEEKKKHKRKIRWGVGGQK